MATVAAVLLVGCTTPGGPTSPDPVRYLLEGDEEPCRVVFGPLAPDPSAPLDEVGAIDTPDGPTLVRRGPATVDRDEPDLEIDGIDVYVTSDAGVVEATWLLPPTEVAVSTRSLTEHELRELLPTLVMTADAWQLAQALEAAIDGADVRDAGPAPDYDVGLSVGVGSLGTAGRGIADARLDAYYANLGWQRADDVAEWTAQVQGAAHRASAATVVAGPDREPVSVSTSTFATVVERSMADAAPLVAVSQGRALAVGAGCEPAGTVPVSGATIRDVSIVESDVGDLLTVTVDGLPVDVADPRLLHLVIGDVELVAPYVGDETVTFPSTLTHAESRLLAERLAR